VIGGIVSVSIEVLQVWTPRVSDPRDIVANGLGTLAGALLGSVIGLVASGVGRQKASSVAAPTTVIPRAVSRPAGRPGAG
jgi:glycopeptide antibiotics resistance protein